VSVGVGVTVLVGNGVGVRVGVAVLVIVGVGVGVMYSTTMFCRLGGSVRIASALSVKMLYDILFFYI
jgi:hypothetical protein